MNGRTRILIGLTLVVLGIGVVAMGYAGGESSVRYVEDLVAKPHKHSVGSFVVMGIPQPQHVPVTGSGGIQLVENPKWANTTATTIRWSDGVQTWFSTRTVTVDVRSDATHWTWRNETRSLPSDPNPAFPVETRHWSTSNTLRVFPIEAFDDGDQHTPRIWSLYGGPLKEAMQPKPSQFTGRLLAQLPDGTELPDGVLVLAVDDFKAGCSSKFLPPEERARQAES